MHEPRYPIYVVSKGRADTCLTARFMIRDGVRFHIVVEPQDAEAYAAAYGSHRILTLPFANQGQGSIPARNWIWQHAIESGAERHWIFDDNIYEIKRRHRGKRIRCLAGPAIAVVEDFTDRYDNIAIAGMNYETFVRGVHPPFQLNTHVYSCLLIRNDLTQRWRGRYNEDTDLCLQVLAAGWCTVLVNAFLIKKVFTMSMAGGNSDELYQGDGRLRMARSLERAWPHVVTTGRRYKRPQHIVRGQWRKFDNEYGLTLRAIRPVKSENLRRMLDGETDG